MQHEWEIRRMHIGYLWESQNELEDQDIGGLMDNIKMDLREIDMAVMGSCEHGNEPSVSVKCWEILD
jgi:hypothetical protein